MFHEYSESSRSVNSLLGMVYGWMSAALILTAITAYTVSHTPSIFVLFYKNPLLLFALFFVQIGLVVFLGSSISKLSFPAAISIFFIYASTVGISLSSLFLLYTGASIVSTFLTTAGMFGGMALYGIYTKADLSGMGSILFMMLFGMIIALFINMFIGNQVVDLFISAIGVVVFTLLTAYDSQKIKYLMQQNTSDASVAYKVTIIGALMLYLDFINLFLYILRFFGKRRD
jgi:uncharacterized protein